ncbi:hypothetical protein [Tellurirhabdus rosea]|uniref:hypothetical protein n=1 Tax=Tellurirhabdus rosea TaxID=2674997 RepID=UPI00224FF399|nr:hypothetical protein [Tellurirhabdus rosea]
MHDHYESVVQFRSRKGTLSANFPKDVSGIDPEKLRLRYKATVEDDSYMQELDAITAFALPRFGQARDEGRRMAAEIEADIRLEPVGVLPLRKSEGYLFLHWSSHPETHIFYFTATLFTGAYTGHRQIRTSYLESARKSLGTTFESLKRDLIRRQPHLPNPATFLVEAKRAVPLEETFLPMARQLVARVAGDSGEGA